MTDTKNTSIDTITAEAFNKASLEEQTRLLASANASQIRQRLEQDPNFLSNYEQEFHNKFSKNETSGNEYAGQELMVREFCMPPKKIEQLYRTHPKWQPESQANPDNIRRTDKFSSLDSAGQIVFLMNLPDSSAQRALKDAAHAYRVDARAIACVAASEGYANLNTTGSSTKNWARGSAGYGTLHNSAILSMHPEWKRTNLEEQQQLLNNVKQFPEKSIPLIAQDMDIKANIYEKISGINIRNNPAILGWAYNTSMTNIVSSAVKQAQHIAHKEPIAFDLTQNTQLGGNRLFGARMGLGSMSAALEQDPMISGLQKLNPPNLNRLDLISPNPTQVRVLSNADTQAFREEIHNDANKFEYQKPLLMNPDNQRVLPPYYQPPAEKLPPYEKNTPYIPNSSVANASNIGNSQASLSMAEESKQTSINANTTNSLSTPSQTTNEMVASTATQNTTTQSTEQILANVLSTPNAQEPKTRSV